MPLERAHWRMAFKPFYRYTNTLKTVNYVYDLATHELDAKNGLESLLAQSTSSTLPTRWRRGQTQLDPLYRCATTSKAVNDVYNPAIHELDA